NLSTCEYNKRCAFWSLNEDILKINDSDYQYAVSIKEDTAYPCLHSPKTTKETSSIRRIQRRPIRRIEDIVCEDSGRYQTWSLLQETPIRRIQSLGYAGRKIYIELRSTSGIKAYDDIPPPPPPPSQTQTPTQQTPHTVSTIKLPILKKGEYDIWAMKMEHYLAHTDYPIWEVIQRGNGPVSVSTDTNGVIKVLPPKIAEEILAREKERKARTTLIMALPEDHLAKFHKITNAKEIWEAI
ncbi:hypothetical protein Tco_0553533, partial [Tanacetum coccineum]